MEPVSTTEQEKWLMIVNPKAQSGALETQWPAIAEQMSLRNFACDVVTTRYRFHAVELVFSAVRQGYRRFIAVGGDGTISEVVNGMFMQREVSVDSLTLGVIPAGSGNDWSRMFGLSKDFSTLFQAFEDGHTIWQDVGVVQVQECGVQKKVYVVNGVGIGLDAEIARRCNQLKAKGRKGHFIYLWAGLLSLFGRRTRQASVWVDDQLFFQGSILSLAMGIGRYTGGGMLQTPEALPDDGLLDVTLIKKASVLRILKEFPKLYSGAIYQIKDKVRWVRGTTVRVECLPSSRVEADGELIGYTQLEFSLLPSALRICVPLTEDRHL